MRRLAGEDGPAAYIPWGSSSGDAAALTTLATQADIQGAADDSGKTWLVTRKAASDVQAGSYGWYNAGGSING